MGGFGESAGTDVPSPISAPNCQRGRFCLHPRPHGGIFIPIPIPTDLHGSCGDPRISNINKKFIFFGQNYDTNMTLFFPFLLKKKLIFHVLF